MQINYDGFLLLSSQLNPEKADFFFNPTTFLQFPSDEFGRISVHDYFDYILRKNMLLEMKTELYMYDSSGTGYLSENVVINVCCILHFSGFGEFYCCEYS